MARKHRSGYGPAGKICVEKADGSHVRVDQETAQKLVREGGKFIPRWQYKGKIKNPVTGEETTADWGHKKTSELCAARQAKLAEEADKKSKKAKKSKTNKETN